MTAFSTIKHKIHQNGLIHPIGLMLASFLLLAAGGLKTPAKEINNSDFPYQDPFVASLAISELSREGGPFLREASHRSLPMPGKRPKYPYTYWRNNASDKLAVMIPGVNSSSKDPVSAVIAKLFYSQGFSVVQISSTLHWTFVQSALSAPAPGYMPNDAKDLQRFLVRLIRHIENKEGRTFTQKHLTGISLGGLITAFVSHFEKEQPQVGIDNYYVVNSPINLKETIHRVDRYYRDSFTYLDSLPEEQWNQSILSFKLTEIFTRNVSPSDVNLMPEEAALAMAYNFKRNLTEFIMVSQEQLDMGIFPHDCGFFSKERCYEFAEQMDYDDYLTEVVAKYYIEYAPDPWEEPVDTDKVYLQASLPAIKDIFRRPRVTFFHTQDDPLMSSGSIQYLDNELSDENLILFRYGGHLGEISDPAFREEFTNVIRRNLGRP